jgi:tetratricopeptide (TPR) repeat protein
MPVLLHFADSKTGGHGATIRLDSGEPCTVSIAQNGARVKKSRLGFLGSVLYKDNNLDQSKLTAKALLFLFDDNLFPLRYRNKNDEISWFSPVLSSFTNAILHCSTCAEVAVTLKEAITKVENQTNRSINDIDWDELEKIQQIRKSTAIIQSDRETTQNRATAYCDRGIAYGGKRDYDRALADFNEAIRLDPKLAAAYYRRGNIYGNKRDYDRAIVEYSKAIQLDPKLADAYYKRGMVFGAKGDHDRAIADYSEVIRLDPEDADTYYKRGMAKQEKGDTAGANADFERSKKINPHRVR